MASYRDFLPVVSAPSGGGWQRPGDWLPLPTVTIAEQKFVGLHGVWEKGDNVVAFLFRGDYTVDWGDGTVENVADNVKAEHQYSWASIPAGTTTSEGYRQVIITVTPNAGDLTSCSFQQRFTARNQAYSTGFLDVTLSMPNAGSGASIVFGGTTVAHRILQRATFVTIGGATSLANLLNGCSSVQSVPLFNTAAVTIMSSMFFNCNSMNTVALFDMGEVVTATSMFAVCNSLRSIPLFNTVKLSSQNGWLNGCNSLQSIPALSTAAITTSLGSDFGSTWAQNTNSLVRCEMVFARTVGFSNAGLGAPALVEIFTNLVDRTATTAATITITGNWGAALLTAGERAIATGKNWNITG
jgi:hypothetical protein